MLLTIKRQTMKKKNNLSNIIKLTLIVTFLYGGSGRMLNIFADNGNTGLEPILQTGRKWAIETWVPGEPDYEPYAVHSTIEVTGDSIMPDGRMVKVIGSIYGVTAVGYENDEGVFVKGKPIDGVEQEFKEIITFNVNVGENLLPGPVSRIENVTFLNHTRKVVFFDYTRYDYPVYWIEGIGSPACQYMESSRYPQPPGVHKRITECWQEDELIYSMEAFNVANSIRETKDATQIAKAHVYDLFGREIADPQPGTVYIRNGRKFVTTR